MADPREQPGPFDPSKIRDQESIVDRSVRLKRQQDLKQMSHETGIVRPGDFDVQGPLDMAAVMTTFIPGVGDAASLAASYNAFKNDPTTFNKVMLGVDIVTPGIPVVGAKIGIGAMWKAMVGSKLGMVGVLSRFPGVKDSSLLRTRLKARSVAEGLEAKGIDPLLIYTETGWSRAGTHGGDWVFELDDSAAKINYSKLDAYYARVTKIQTELESNGVKMPLENIRSKLPKIHLEDIVDYPELFEAFPQLRRIVMDVDDAILKQSPPLRPGGEVTKGAGQANISDNTLYVDSRKGDEFRTTVLHELQHFIQAMEGVQSGSASRGSGMSLDAVRQLHTNYSLRQDNYIDTMNAYKVVKRELGDIGLDKVDDFEIYNVLSKHGHDLDEDNLARLLEWVDDPSLPDIDRTLVNTNAEKLSFLQEAVTELDIARRNLKGKPAGRTFKPVMEDTLTYTTDQAVLNQFIHREYLRVWGETEARNVEWRELSRLHGYALGTPAQSQAAMMEAERLTTAIAPSGTLATPLATNRARAVVASTIRTIPPSVPVSK